MVNYLTTLMEVRFDRYSKPVKKIQRKLNWKIMWQFIYWFQMRQLVMQENFYHRIVMVRR